MAAAAAAAIAAVRGVVSGSGPRATVWWDGVAPGAAAVSLRGGDGAEIVARIRPLWTLPQAGVLADTGVAGTAVVSEAVAAALWGWRERQQLAPGLALQLQPFPKDVVATCRSVVLEMASGNSAGSLDIRTGSIVRQGSLVGVGPFLQSFAAVAEIDAGGAAVGKITRATAVTVREPTPPPQSAANADQGLTETAQEAALVEHACATLGEYVRPAAQALARWVVAGAAEGPDSCFGKGLLLHGPSGVGKSELVRVVLDRAGVVWAPMAPEELFRGNKGEGEAVIQERLLGPAVSSAAALRVVVLDGVDLLGPQHAGHVGRVLLASMDRAFATAARVLVLGVTNALEHVDPALLQAKRLGRRVHLEAPRGKALRLDLAQRLLEQHGLGDDEKVLAEAVAARGIGLVPAEMEAAVRDLVAAEQEAPGDAAGAVQRVFADIRAGALKDDQSAAIQTLGPAPSADWAGVGGLEVARKALETSVLLPLREPDRLRRLGMQRGPRGVLLFGPSGNGKTLLASALCTIADEQGLANTVMVRCTDLISKVVGESEAAIVRVFRRAAAAAPCILFLDHVEAIAPRRGHDSSSEQTMDRVLSCLLTEMDGIQAKTERGREAAPTIVVAATERRERLDPAILRAGRFDQHVLVGPPESAEERAAVLRVALARTPFAGAAAADGAREEALTSVAGASEAAGLSRAELAGAAREAAMLALRESLECEGVARRHLEAAMQSASANEG